MSLIRLKNELIEGRSVKEWLFLVFGLIIQFAAFLGGNMGILSLVSGIAGVISVVLCSQRKISFYFFGFIQLFTYIALCLHENLYGELCENIFYGITMVVGIFLWLKNYDTEVESKILSKRGWLIWILGIIVGGLLIGFILSRFTNDSQPFLDSYSTMPAIVAQILMISKYREQWFFWIIVDILTGILWFRAGDWCMVSQYVFWTVNCIYGFKKWSK